MRTQAARKRFPPKGGFGRNVMLVAASTGVGQIISLSMLPALTRLYTPSELGRWGLYLAVLLILLVPSSLRYELAIPLPSSDMDAAAIVALSVWILLGTTMLLSLIVILAAGVLLPHLGVTVSAGLWLLPFGFFSLGLYQVLNYWSVRKAEFRLIAGASVSQSAAQSIAQVGLGLSGFGTGGVIGGDVIGRAAGVAVFSVREFRVLHQLRLSPDRPPLKSVAQRYRRFPLISSWSGVLNVSGIQLPILLIAAAFGSVTVGFFALAQRLMIAPITLVSSSVSQVFISEAAGLARNDYEGLKALVERLTRRLAMWAAPPALVFFVLAPWAFRMVFGSDWVIAGQIARWLVPSAFAQFVLSAVAPILNVIERQDLQLRWDVVRFVLLGLLLLWVGSFASAIQTVIAYSLGLTTLYVFLFVTYLRVLSAPNRRPSA
jgi:O-antigen/teichoic acid export membrane protein